MCRSELITDQDLKLDMVTTKYILDLDRGGLKWPTEFLMEVVTQVFCLFRVLVSEEFESVFLIQHNQRQTFVKLAIEHLKCQKFTEGYCEHGCPTLKIAEYTLSYLSNIFINNYSKNLKDKSKAGKRKNIQKLSTVGK